MKMLLPLLIFSAVWSISVKANSIYNVNGMETLVVEPSSSEEVEGECGVSDPEAAADTLMAAARTLLEDPADLPNRDGIVSLTGGEMWGLSSLNRSGTVTVTCDDRSVTLLIILKAEKPLRARYDWDKKVSTRTVKGVAYARVTDFQALVTVQAPRFLSSEPARVTSLEVSRLEDVEVNVSGLANISWLWSRAIAFMSSVFDKALSTVVQERLWSALDQALLRQPTSSTPRIRLS